MLAHNLKVAGSNPAPAPNLKPSETLRRVSYFVAFAIFERAVTLRNVRELSDASDLVRGPVFAANYRNACLEESPNLGARQDRFGGFRVRSQRHFLPEIFRLPTGYFDGATRFKRQLESSAESRLHLGDGLHLMVIAVSSIPGNRNSEGHGRVERTDPAHLCVAGADALGPRRTGRHGRWHSSDGSAV